MAMMAKMRNLAPAFILFVGGIFVLFMVISDSRVTEIFGAGANNIGSVNGEEITYQQFSNFLETSRENQKQQTGRDVEEEQMDALNDQTWESIVTQQLFKEQIEKFGITVSDEEVNEIIFSPNPPAFLKNYFVDSLGRFNRQLYESTILRQKKEVLLDVEERVRQMRLTEKLQNYLFASINVSEGEIKRRFTDQNTQAKVEYLIADVNRIADNEVSVSQEDLKSYYEKNIDKYKVDHQRKIKYVLFSKLASKEDSTSVKNNLTAIVEKAKDDTSFKSYVEIYSEQPYSKDTIKQNQLSAEASSLLANSTPGQIVGPVSVPEGYVVYRLINKVPSKETFVRASHILVPIAGDENKAKEEADKIYNQLVAGADFAKMAMEKSTDPGSARKGGDLGYFGKGQMVKEFEDAAFNGKIGQIQKPVKTNYGYHIIKTTGKSTNDFVVEKIVNKVKVSGATVENAYSAATDFTYLSDKNGYESEAKLMNYKIQETPLFSEDAFSIPGIGMNKNLLEWVFESDLNDISPVFKTRQGYIVATVSEIQKAGAKKFEDVEKTIKPLALREKKLEKAKAMIDKVYDKVKTGGSFNTAITKYVMYDTTGSFNVSASVPGIGRDYKFMYLTTEIPINQVSEPFKGLRGYYIIRVLEKTPFNSSLYAMQRNTLRDQLLQEKKSYFFEQWLSQLKKDADIVDNRSTFYR